MRHLQSMLKIILALTAALRSYSTLDMTALVVYLVAVHLLCVGPKTDQYEYYKVLDPSDAIRVIQQARLGSN